MYTVFQITYAMGGTTIFPCIMAMISNFTIFLMFHIFIFKFFFTNIADFTFFYCSWCYFINQIIFFILELIITIVCYVKDSQKFFMQSFPVYIMYISSYVYIIFIFYIFKWRYCRHWKTWWNMFFYFCCEWTFRIIFTSISLFY